MFVKWGSCVHTPTVSMRQSTNAHGVGGGAAQIRIADWPLGAVVALATGRSTAVAGQWFGGHYNPVDESLTAKPVFSLHRKLMLRWALVSRLSLVAALVTVPRRRRGPLGGCLARDRLRRPFPPVIDMYTSSLRLLPSFSAGE